MNDERWVILESKVSHKTQEFIQQTMGLAGIDDLGEFLKKSVTLYRLAIEAVRGGGGIAIVDDEGESIQEIAGIIVSPVDFESGSA